MDGAPAFVRAFIALPISEGARARLSAALDALGRSGARVAWVPPENLHLSLAFLGDLEPGTVVRTAGLLTEVAAVTAPFVFESAGVGAFGSQRSPRVIWAGVGESAPLRVLQDAVARGMRALGVEVETREFRPHLTLGRVRSPHGSAALRAAMERLAQERFGAIRADRVLLMRSELSPRGSRYSILHEAAFGRATDG